MKIYKLLVIAVCAVVFAACASGDPSGAPGDAMRRYHAAVQKKDAAAAKQALSKGSLVLLEQSAKMQNTTLDDLLKQDNPAMSPEAPEIRNEKIEGDTATIEVKNSVTGNFDTLPVVREDGAWKLALDKYVEDVKNAKGTPTPVAP